MTPSDTDTGIQAREVIAVLRRHLWIVVLITLLITAAVAAPSFELPKSYAVKVVVLPVSQNSSSGRMSGLSSLVSSLGGGGLSGLADLGSTDTQKTEAIAVLQSDALVRRYIEQKNVLQIIQAR